MDSARKALERQMKANGTTLAAFSQQQKFRPLVIVGPSGVGKGTVIERLTKQSYPDSFGFSVSYTTRGPRPGEVDGQHYNFVD